MSAGKLPEGWATSTINEMCNLNPKLKLDDDLDVGFMPMAGVPTTYLGKCNFETKKWNEVKKGFTQFQNDDVIFAKITPCFENGKAVVIKEFPNGYGAGSTEYYVLRSINGLINPHWLFALVKTKDFLTNGALNMSGSVGHKRVTKEFVENYFFPVPPLAEQKVIAEKLDTLLAQVDSTKARLEQIPQILKRFRQAVLTVAMSGELTEEWRKSNSILFSSWVNSNIGELAQVATGKTPKRTEVKYWENGSIPWLTSSSTGEIYTEVAEQFITPIALKECTLKIFSPGTLLLAMYGEGKTRGQVTELKIHAACNQACAAIICNKEKIDLQFLKMRLMENYQETRKAAAGGNQPNLNLNKVREIPVIVPPLPEQAEIVRRVEQLFAYADTIEKQVNNALARVNSLTQSILAKAFRGELTAQWRAEHPDLISGENSAAALLEKIKAERAASGGKKTSRKKA